MDDNVDERLINEFLISRKKSRDIDDVIFSKKDLKKFIKNKRYPKSIWKKLIKYQK